MCYTSCIYIFKFYYPACNAHAPNFYLCPVRLYNIPTLSHKRQDFRKNITEDNVFRFSLQVLSETF